MVNKECDFDDSLFIFVESVVVCSKPILINLQHIYNFQHLKGISSILFPYSELYR